MLPSTKGAAHRARPAARKTAFPDTTTALVTCVDLAAMGPQESVEQFVGAGHGRIARALDATGGHVGVARRMRVQRDDPLLGFRVNVMYEIAWPDRAHLVDVQTDVQGATYVHDPVIQAIARDAGRTRVYHGPNPRQVPVWHGTLDEKYWSLRGLADRLKLVYTLTPNLEVHFGFDRPWESRGFGPREVRLLEGIAVGVGPWVERVALMLGLAEGLTSLSPRESEIACRLLGYAPLKQIADELDMSEPHARDLVRSVYRKLRVGGRAELSFRWSSRRPALANRIHTSCVRRRRASVNRAHGRNRSRT